MQSAEYCLPAKDPQHPHALSVSNLDANAIEYAHWAKIKIARDIPKNTIRSF